MSIPVREAFPGRMISSRGRFRRELVHTMAERGGWAQGKKANRMSIMILRREPAADKTSLLSSLKVALWRRLAADIRL